MDNADRVPCDTKSQSNQSPKPNKVILLPEPNPSATLARFIFFI